MKRRFLPTFLSALAALIVLADSAHAAFIVEAVASGRAFANFSLVPNTTTVSSSTAFSQAVGLTGTSSVFGGNGTAADVYRFSYTPGVDADNFAFAPGAPLGSTGGFPGNGYTASGLVGGASGIYNVYFTTPDSANVNTLGSTFTITQDGPALNIGPVNLNSGGTGPDTNPGTGFVGGANNAWYLLGAVALSAGMNYTVTQTSGSPPSFVSQRASGMMWELLVPEPASIVLLGIAAIGAVGLIRRRA